jgi:SNF2 family DNA or RNA helicase
MSKFNQTLDWFIEKSKIQRKEYQVEGIQWCVNKETQPDPLFRVRGGLIADEMGLGKTIMMIATFVVHFMPKTLIILPNALIEQWHSEIYRTTGHLALIYHGAAKKLISLDQLNSSRIVLATYAAVAVNQKTDDGLSLLHRVSWDRIVFDEAHHLRNRNSRWRGAKRLKSKVRWLITGTPVQNKRSDFNNLCNILRLPQGFYVDDANLPHIVADFVLRRTKKSVGIDIPQLQLANQPVTWNNVAERKLSRDIHCALKVSRVKLKMMLHARQSCIYPALLKGSADKLAEKMLIKPFKPETLHSSTKLDAVVNTILQRKDNGNGKLVFCHFKGEMDTIIHRLRENGLTSVTSFDGRVSQAKRARRLKDAYQVIVLQIQTGCEGLNLQNNFSEVYFVSPNWNPSIEDQAVARCHRIGQTKPVDVFRFYMNTIGPTGKILPTQTLDQYIESVQLRKRKISSAIFAS